MWTDVHSPSLASTNGSKCIEKSRFAATVWACDDHYRRYIIARREPHCALVSNSEVRNSHGATGSGLVVCLYLLTAKLISNFLDMNI
jgi:hypothetical protein